MQIFEIPATMRFVLPLILCACLWHLCEPDRCGTTEYSDIDENICKV